MCKQQLNKTDTEICGICFCEDDQQVQSEQVDWMSCALCSLWVHKNCVSAKDINEENYVCFYCS